MVKVLLAVEDPRLASTLDTALRRSGHDVCLARSALQALTAAPPDLVMLDYGQSRDNGINLCRMMRDRSAVAIIMMSARGSVRDRVAGLRAGADDYLVRPFSWAELAARMEALQRRIGGRHTGSLVVGQLHVDVARHQVYLGPEPVALTRKEFQVLVMLVREAGAVVSRDRLIAEIWGNAWPGRSRTLDVHVATLRAKLSSVARVVTVRGVGYRLVDAEMAVSTPGGGGGSG